MQEAVDSVLGQRNFPDWHLYMVNDGSDDVDVPIAREFCTLYPNKISLLEHAGGRRRGTSASRNLGIHHARGEFISFLDADDTWYPDKLKHQVGSLEKCRLADMIYGPALRWHSWNGGFDIQVPVKIDGFGSDCLVPGQALLAAYLHDESQCPCTGSVLIRTSAVRRAGCFEEHFPGVYDDQVFYAKLCRTSQILISSKCASRYRQHPNSCCRRAEANGEGLDERDRFLDWLRQYEERACA